MDNYPQLPTDAKFSPNITLRVRDIRALPPEMGQSLLTHSLRTRSLARLLTCSFACPGGMVLGKPLVASGIVALEPLLPWSKNYAKKQNPLVKAAMAAYRGRPRYSPRCARA